MHALASDPRLDTQACRALLRAGSQSFHAASRLLPGWLEARAVAFYAFCRVADDAIDEGGGPSALGALEARLGAIFTGSPRADAVDRALARVVDECNVPRALFEALLEGFAWDLEGRAYREIEDLHAYGARVAGAVGAIMTLLMGQREPWVLARAADLGVAMQLTNIARDVGEDARLGRVYLPEAWLAEAGVDRVELLRTAAPSLPLASVVARLLDEADQLYARADHGIAALPADCRTAIRAARLIYADIGRVIRARGCDSVTTRARTSGWRKGWLLLRAVPARFWRITPDHTPALAANAFLVDAAAQVAA